MSPSPTFCTSSFTKKEVSTRHPLLLRISYSSVFLMALIPDPPLYPSILWNSLVQTYFKQTILYITPLRVWGWHKTTEANNTKRRVAANKWLSMSWKCTRNKHHVGGINLGTRFASITAERQRICARLDNIVIGSTPPYKKDYYARPDDQTLDTILDINGAWVIRFAWKPACRCGQLGARTTIDGLQLVGWGAVLKMCQSWRKWPHTVTTSTY